MNPEILLPVSFVVLAAFTYLGCALAIYRRTNIKLPASGIYTYKEPYSLTLKDQQRQIRVVEVTSRYYRIESLDGSTLPGTDLTWAYVPHSEVDLTTYDQPTITTGKRSRNIKLK